MHTPFIGFWGMSGGGLNDLRIMPTCITLKRCSNSDKGHCFQADKKHAIPSKELGLPQVPQSVNRGM